MNLLSLQTVHSVPLVGRVARANSKIGPASATQATSLKVSFWPIPNAPACLMEAFPVKHVAIELLMTAGLDFRPVRGAVVLYKWRVLLVQLAFS